MNTVKCKTQCMCQVLRGQLCMIIWCACTAHAARVRVCSSMYLLCCNGSVDHDRCRPSTAKGSITSTCYHMGYLQCKYIRTAMANVVCQHPQHGAVHAILK